MCDAGGRQACPLRPGPCEAWQRREQNPLAADPRNKAEQRRDIRALDQLLAGTLAYPDYDGSFYTKAQFLESVRNAAEAIESLVNEQVSVHAYESSAVVTEIYREKGAVNGKPHTRRGRFTDTWVKQSGAWPAIQH